MIKWIKRWYGLIGLIVFAICLCCWQLSINYSLYKIKEAIATKTPISFEVEGTVVARNIISRYDCRRATLTPAPTVFLKLKPQFNYYYIVLDNLEKYSGGFNVGFMKFDPEKFMLLKSEGKELVLSANDLRKLVAQRGKAIATTTTPIVTPVPTKTATLFVKICAWCEKPCCQEVDIRKIDKNGEYVDDRGFGYSIGGRKTKILDGVFFHSNCFIEFTRETIRHLKEKPIQSKWTQPFYPFNSLTPVEIRH